MDEMTAFDRQIAGEVLLGAGPSEPVDDLAIYEAVVSAGRPHTWGVTMYSALKLIAAAVIVALFGGFLLAGGLLDGSRDTTAPAASGPSLTDTPIDRSLGYTFEDVSPGVRRVVSDGVRELGWLVPAADDGDQAFSLGAIGNIAAGPDGSAWVIWDDELIRLGDPSVLEWHTDALGNTDYRIEVGPDGRLWLAYGDLVSYGPAGREVHVESPRYGEFWDLAVLPDGDVLALRRFGTQAIGRYGRDGWHEMSDVPADDILALEASDAGDLWLLASEQIGDDVHRVVYDHSDGWHALELPDDGAMVAHDITGAEVSGLSVTPGGTLWISLRDDDWTCEPDWCAIGPDALARYAGAGWEVFSPTTGMPPLGPSSYQTGRYLEASPDGSVWVQRAGDPTATGTDCAGIANFDGDAWRFYLEDLCVYAMDVAPDGTVWSLAGPRTAWGPEPKLPNAWPRFEGAPAGSVSLYVIASEAPAASR